MAGPGELDRVIARARQAQPAWAAASVAERCRWLSRARRALRRSADELARTIAAETGKTYEDALLTEVAHVIRACRYWARSGPTHLADERVSGRLARTTMLVRRRPAGVIAVIAPSNYPLALGLGEALPALLAGNAVVLKPSPCSPRTSAAVLRLLARSGLPAGVLQVLEGDAETGDALVGVADVVAFTGSTAAGRRVAHRAAQSLTPVFLELGGKDPMIVLADADLDRAATHAVYYGMFSSGQACASVERVYVEAPVFDEFVQRVVDRVKALRVTSGSVGPGRAEVGTLTRAEQVETVQAHVQDAIALGAKVLTGGKIGPAPLSFAPTVLVGVDHTMRIMREETFGPVLPIMRVADAEEAASLANDSEYGLQASIFSADRAQAERIGARLDCGVVCVNDAVRNFSALALPMGGHRASGLGVRHGAPGIRRFCTQQSVFSSPPSSRNGLHMFPNRRLATNAARWVLRLAG
jgi:acyl-CoA reductase-like NAD-dependent aldehyde dehydrogenase